MSIFEKIKSAIFGRSAAAQETGPATVPVGGAPSAGTAPPPIASPPSGSAGAAAAVDVAAILDGLAKQNKQKLNWRVSIVDLMKLLDLDSSLTARKKLAAELHYTGNTKTAPMNIWLHKQVMIKLAENGGKVPAELRS